VNYTNCYILWIEQLRFGGGRFFVWRWEWFGGFLCGEIVVGRFGMGGWRKNICVVDWELELR
jgi:hypothetical protein